MRPSLSARGKRGSAERSKPQDPIALPLTHQERACLEQIWAIWLRGRDDGTWPIPSVLARTQLAPDGAGELDSVLRQLAQRGYLVKDATRNYDEPQLVLTVRGLAALPDCGGTLGSEIVHLVEWLVALNEGHKADNEHPFAHAESQAFSNWLLRSGRVTDLRRAAISVRDLRWLISHEAILCRNWHGHSDGSWAFDVPQDVRLLENVRALDSYVEIVDQWAGARRPHLDAQPAGAPGTAPRQRERFGSWGPWHPNNMAAGVTQGVLASLVFLVIAGTTAALIAWWPDTKHLRAETAGGVVHTHTDYTTASGTGGALIQPGQTVRVACRVLGYAVQPDGDRWWYRLHDAPWSDAYYATADAFYNGAATSGSLVGTPQLDPKVPIC